MFGESVSFASVKEAKQKAIELGNKFDWEWAARNMLEGAAWEGYAKAEGAAWEGYAKAEGAAWEGYAKVKGAAWEGYAKVKGAAFAEALWKSGIGKRSGPRQAR